MTVSILTGDCIASMQALPAATFQTCVTSPPYYGLRDYGVAGQIGLEDTPDAYLARMVDVMREVRRVLRDDGTLWLNIGDSYAGNGGYSPDAPSNKARQGVKQDGVFKVSPRLADRQPERRNKTGPGLKTKDLLGIPWALAFALRADGWYLRSDIIWNKKNPMPESVRDRPTSAHEHVFLLTKRPSYFYDADALREPHLPESIERVKTPVNAHAGAASVTGERGAKISQGGERALVELNPLGRNARNVWTIATQPFSGAHFATMPPDLAERCIKAGSRAGDHVLDPFGGAGTTGLVSDRLGRHATLCELNPEYAALARERITADAPLLGAVA
jgi:DNA modification methylase